MRLTKSERAQSQTFVLIGAGTLLLVGAFLFMLLNGAMNELFTMGRAVTDNADSTTAINYVEQGWLAFPLIILGLFVFYLLVGAVYSSDVGRGGRL